MYHPLPSLSWCWECGSISGACTDNGAIIRTDSPCTARALWRSGVDSTIVSLHWVLCCHGFPLTAVFKIVYDGFKNSSHHTGWLSMHSFRLRHLFYIFDKEQLCAKKSWQMFDLRTNSSVKLRLISSILSCLSVFFESLCCQPSYGTQKLADDFSFFRTVK